MGTLKKIVFATIVGMGTTAMMSEAQNHLPAGFKLVYQTDFTTEGVGGLDLQAATSEAFAVVNAPGNRAGKVLKVTLRKSDNFSHVANGAPRAEANFARKFQFKTGGLYFVGWSIYIPPDYQLDSKQPEGITQIHESVPKGTPPFSITIINGHYRVDLRTADDKVATSSDLGSIEGDKGKWTNWGLYYRPDNSGINAICELLKNNVMVFNADGKPNAWPDDNNAYFKLGIYKWWWKTRSSDVTERILYFGDVVAGVK